jgi:PAS domain-containing protein
MSAGIHSEPEAPLWRAIFDALPLPAFIVDEDLRILHYNTVATQLLGPAPKSSLWRRGGEVLHCVASERQGCGGSKLCRNCIIRNSVKEAVGGMDTFRKLHRAELRGSRGATPVKLLVTARRLSDATAPKVLLVLENVAQTLQVCKQHLDF